MTVFDQVADWPQRVLVGATLGEVVVDTTKPFQGLTYGVNVAWHAVAGGAAAVRLDPGRPCLRLTRHRHACIVGSRDRDGALLDGVAPANPGYLGRVPDPILDGRTLARASSTLSSPTG